MCRIGKTDATTFQLGIRREFDIAYVRMDIETSIAERVIHLALFCVAGAGAGLIGFAALERIAAGTRVIRPLHVVVSFAAFGAVLVLERVWHALH